MFFVSKPTIDLGQRDARRCPLESPETLAFGNNHLGFPAEFDEETEFFETNWRSSNVVLVTWVLHRAFRQYLTR